MNIETRNKITNVSFLLAIFIVWHHTYNVDVYHLTGILKWFEKYMMYVFDTAVSLFFMLSAFLFYYNVDENNILHKLKSRITSLIIPYLLWNLIGYIYFQLLAIFPVLRQYYGGGIEPFSINGMIKAMFTGDYNLVTWFLRNLIVYTFTFPVLYKVLKNKYAYILVFAASFLLSYFYASKSELIAYVTYYVIGIGFAYHGKKLFLRRYSKKERISALIIFMILIGIFTYFEISDTSIIRIVIYSICSYMMWIFLDFLANNKEAKWYEHTGFIFFVSHEMILEPVEKLFYLLLGDNVHGAILDYIFAPMITILIIIGVSYVLRKIPVLWSVLSGHR